MRLAAVLVALWMSPALACVVEVRNDPGGVITEYEARLADYNRRGCEVRLYELIQSSATIYLGAAHVCLGSPMWAQFHGPSWNGRRMAPVDFHNWKWRLSENYPTALRVWYRAVIRDHTTIWTIRRDELIRLGVPSC